MTITTTIHQEKEIEVEIPSFYFSKTSDTIIEAAAILSETEMREIFIHESRVSVVSSTPNSYSHTLSIIISKWERTTEERFMEIHAEAMKKLSLTPELKTV